MAVPSNAGIEIKHLKTLTALAEQGIAVPTRMFKA